MKLLQLAIGSILFLEAMTLLYSTTEKYNFHSSLLFLKSQWQHCSYMQNLCFECIENIRLFVVAFIFTGAISLTFCHNSFIGFLAQLIWTLTQNESYYSTGILQTKNTMIQILFTAILLGLTFNEFHKSKNKKSLPNPKQLTSLTKEQQLLKEAVNPQNLEMVCQKKKESGKKLQKIQDEGVQKQKSRKSKKNK